MTECTQTSFTFATEFRRELVANFDGGTITTEAGSDRARAPPPPPRNLRGRNSRLEVLALEDVLAQHVVTYAGYGR